jgi:orotate phosphoribosyltransferase
MPGKLPGTTYNWIFYLRNGLFNPDFLHCVSEMMLFKLYKELGNYNFQICGAETAGTPLAASIPLVAKAHQIPMSGFVVRKEQKEYGLKNWHEGMAFKDIPYVVVDDLCNSSRSLAHADNICRNTLGIVPSNVAIVIVNKVNKKVHSEERAVTDMYTSKDVKVLSLFDLDSFDLSDPSH